MIKVSVQVHTRCRRVLEASKQRRLIGKIHGLLFFILHASWPHLCHQVEWFRQEFSDQKTTYNMLDLIFIRAGFCCVASILVSLLFSPMSNNKAHKLKLLWTKTLKINAQLLRILWSCRESTESPHSTPQLRHAFGVRDSSKFFCQWTTVACENTPGYFVYLLLCWFIWGCRLSPWIWKAGWIVQNRLP